MAVYQGPNKELYRYDAKFIRIGSRILTTDVNDVETPHDNLALIEGVLEIIQGLRLSDPSSVDAGYYGVDNEIYLIDVVGDSSRLKLPRKPEARPETVVIFQKLSPGYTVKSHE